MRKKMLRCAKKSQGGKIDECKQFFGLTNARGTCWIDGVLTALTLSDVSKLFMLKLELLLEKYETPIRQCEIYLDC